MFKKRVLRSTRRVKKRRQKLLHRVILVSSSVLIIFFSVVYISHSNFFLIQTIDVVGNTVITAPEVQNLVSKELEGNYFGLFPRSHILLYPKKTIEEHILSSFYWVLDVRTQVAGKDKIVVRLREREPKALWCTEISEEESCYLLDTNGFVFAPAPSFSSDVYIRYFGEIKGDPLGGFFLPEQFSKVTAFVDLIKERELNPLRVIIDEHGDGKLVLKQGEILFDGRDDLSASFENLDSFLRENEKEFTVKPFEYIDLRFGNKIFYK